MIKPMLAKELKAFRHKLAFPVLVQPKLNGVRMIVEDTRYYSRTGKALNISEALAKEIKSIRRYLVNICLDGELYRHGVPLGCIVGNAKSLKTHRNDVDLQFHFFDLADACLGTSQRMSKLRKIPQTKRIRRVPVQVANNDQDISSWLDHYVKQGYEGIMVRSFDSHYQQRRSSNLLKEKPWLYTQAQVVGFVEGKGKYKAMLGAMKIVGVENGTAYRANLGGGFNDAERHRLWKNRFSLAGLIVSFKYLELTEAGVPYGLIFVEFKS